MTNSRIETWLQWGARGGPVLDLLHGMWVKMFGQWCHGIENGIMVVMFLSMWTKEVQKISLLCISNRNFRRQFLYATFLYLSVIQVSSPLCLKLVSSSAIQATCWEDEDCIDRSTWQGALFSIIQVINIYWYETWLGLIKETTKYQHQHKTHYEIK